MKVWITGASSGIGEACALRYASLGASLVLTSSNEARLRAVAARCAGAAAVTVLVYDFSNPDGVETLVNTAWTACGGIDIAFLNAGISQRTCIVDTTMDMVRKIMEIDYFAPVAAARALLPLMLGAGGGSIAVTSSIAGRFGFPLRCAYSSAKHALYGFFETMQAEYGDRGIHVTIVCPGRVNTNISFASLDKGGRPHGVMDPGQASGMSAEAAARKIVKAVARRRREVLVGRGELAMVYVKRFFPGLCARLSKRLRPV